MISCDYLIVGGQMTAHACAEGIREVDGRGSIVMVGDDPQAPYNRPPLSKGLWKGDALDTIWRKPVPGLDERRGLRIRSLDVAERRAEDDRGEEYRFKRCLLATGGRPRRLPFGGERIVYFRTLADFSHLRHLCEEGKRFAVIGGGFIGQEIAAALAMNGKAVTMLFPGRAIGSHVYPGELSTYLNEYYRTKGVVVLPGYTATGLRERGSESVLQIRGDKGDERDLIVDGVVAGIGIEPSLELARQAGLEVDDGVVVDERLQTSAPDVYAAGDVASFFNPHLGRRIRVEHEDHANASGRAAGRAMAGADARYDYLPFFYSDLFDLGYEAIGELDSRAETVADWQEPYRQGVIYYRREGRVRGVLLWGIFSQVDRAREMIASGRAWEAAELRGRIGQEAGTGGS